MGGNPFAAPGKAEPFGRGRLDADRAFIHPGEPGNFAAHSGAVGADLGRFANDGEVDIADPVAGLRNQFCGMFEKLARARAFPLRVAGREMGADIAIANRAQNRIGDRMQRHIGIRMPGQAMRVVQLDPAQPQFFALDQFVHIKALADPKGGLG